MFIHINNDRKMQRQTGWTDTGSVCCDGSGEVINKHNQKLFHFNGVAGGVAGGVSTSN